MSGPREPGFFYLNAEGRWPKFERRGLEAGDGGALRLGSLPRLEGELPAEIAGLREPPAPSGLAVAPDGTVYWSDPEAHRILAINPCDRSRRPVPCAGGEGSAPTELDDPRGLLVHLGRRALVVADAGNHRLQLFALGSFQLVDVWGGPGTEPGRFDTPQSLAADGAGNVYVADAGNFRVQKLDAAGRVIPAFWKEAQGEAPELRPSEVAVAGEGDETEVHVLDAERDEIAVFDAEGQLRRTVPLPAPVRAMGIALGGGTFLGDNASRRLLRLYPDGSLAGEAPGYEGPVAALAADRRGGLWLLPGGGVSPLRLGAAGGFVKSGVLWGGPFGALGRPLAWHRLRALGAVREPRTRFRFFVFTSDGDEPPPPPVAADGGPGSFDESPWRALPQDLPDALVGGAPAQRLWVGVQLGSDGGASPRLEQLRIDFDHETYTQYLPAVYAKRAPDPGVLDRFLSLFESLFVDVESEIARLDRLFDPWAAPAGWLEELAGWLALDLEEDWSEEKKRRAIAQAFAAYAWRGTARGLREAIRFRTGVEARIEEPLLHAAWWSLPEGGAGEDTPATAMSILGFTTALAPAEPQGAVLGTSAVFDQSHLITAQELGTPLFEETAHRFTVGIYDFQAHEPETLRRVRAVVESEKPAHTTYQLCVIGPRLRVGFQARIGVDTVVGGGGPPSPSRLGEPESGGAGVTLAGELPARLGEGSRIGRTARLGDGVVHSSNGLSTAGQDPEEEPWS